jgi:hypothetical protein
MLPMQAANKSLFSVQSPEGILGEFNSDETIDHFRTDWWEEFHHAVDDDASKAQTMIGGKQVIVIGLLGLDCASGHDCNVELHPIYILAIQVSETVPNEHWVFFARNEGDEGACSGGISIYPGLP